jgi:hypothetical protein
MVRNSKKLEYYTTKNFSRLAMNAFKNVLKRRQSKYTEVLMWVNERINKLGMKHGKECGRLGMLVEKSRGAKSVE